MNASNVSAIVLSAFLNFFSIIIYILQMGKLRPKVAHLVNGRAAVSVP